MQNCAWRTGFKLVSNEEIETLVDNIDHDRQELYCIPLARPFKAHNPVYGFKAGAGPCERLIWDVGMMHRPDKWGLVAIAPLERGAINTNEYWCAKVRLPDGQEGWINVARRYAPREYQHRHQPRGCRANQWRMYFKLVVISRCLCGDCKRAWLACGWRCKKNC